MTCRLFVSGSSGHVGSAVLRELMLQARPDAGIEIIAGVSGLGHTSEPPTGVHWRLCPYGDRDQMLRALEGVDAAFMMIPFGGQMQGWGRQFVDCARHQGVRFIVRLSGLAASPDSGSAMGRLQGQVDEVLRQSGIDYCILRCNSFMQNFRGMYRPMIQRGTLALAHGEACISFIDTDDIGSVAASILLNPRGHSSATLDLHGPQALSNEEVIRCISGITGRDLRYVPITEEKSARGYRRAKLPDWEVEVFLSLDKYLRDGHGQGSGQLLEQLLGRSAGSFESFARRHKALWV